MRPYVKDGTVKTVVLWNPVDLGYLTIHVARSLADGKLQRGLTALPAGRLKAREVREDEVLLGDPLRFTRENIDDYQF
jgi:ABC-type sugar transport system substrate-binding protein